MKLHAIKAFEGDCLLLETGDNPPRFALIDGGPANTYDRYARKYLKEVVGNGGHLALIIVSHVDGDHIIGVLDLLADLERQIADGENQLFTIGDVWHNSFEDSIDDSQGTISAGLQAMLAAAGAAKTVMSETALAFLGIPEGVKLRRSVIRLGLPLNGAFNELLISPDTLTNPVFALGDVSLRVVGPTDANLRELRTKWLEWLEANAQALLRDPLALANADISVPNLSSIVLLAESGGRRMLLTGDARGDHIEQGLEAAGLLNGGLHVDVLKVQHHGSNRNITKKFLKRITADTYVISGNGKHDNPDHDTLTWIVEAANEAGRPIKILVTHESASLDALRDSHPEDAWGYKLTTAGSKRAVTVEL